MLNLAFTLNVVTQKTFCETSTVLNVRRSNVNNKTGNVNNNKNKVAIRSLQSGKGTEAKLMFVVILVRLKLDSNI